MAAALDGWQDRIRTIAGGLLTLEVNTIEKSNMSASKMPEFPIALHDIAVQYSDDLAKRRICITDALLAAAQARIDDGQDASHRVALENWDFRDDDRPTASLTNGPATFEALRWAAYHALHTLDGLATPRAASSDQIAVDIDVDRGLLARMMVNAGELRQIGLLLLEQLKELADARRLFDGTRDDTVAVLFRHPRPIYDIDADMQLVVRKIWDIGLDRVLFQTTMQVDGDVVVRVAPDLDATRREFYSAMHRATVETGIRQWRGLFDVASALASEVGRVLFSR